MQAALAPQMWAEGQTQQVLKYVADDFQLTLDVAKSAGNDGRFAWITRRGTESNFLFDRRSLAYCSRSDAIAGAGHVLDGRAAVETGTIHGLARAATGLGSRFLREFGEDAPRPTPELSTPPTVGTSPRGLMLERATGRVARPHVCGRTAAVRSNYPNLGAASDSTDDCTIVAQDGKPLNLS